jgi:hypothetical protein
MTFRIAAVAGFGIRRTRIGSDIMGDIRFEPFGESVEDSDILKTPQDEFSRRLERVGMGIFWGLVGVVVVARALYFDPDIGARFAGGLAHTVGALLGTISLS